MRKTIVAVMAFAAALTVTGCAASTSAPAPTSTVQAQPNVDACTYLSGGALENAVDFFLAYTTDREAADQEVLADIVERFESASVGADVQLGASLDDALTELRAIEQRYATGDAVDPAVDYQVLADSLDRAMALCVDALEG